MKRRSEPFSQVPLGRLGRLMKGYGGTRADAVDSGVPCVRYGDLYTYHKEFVVAAKSYLEPETAKNYFPLRQGDVIFAASGETLEEIGKSAEVLLEGEVRCGGDTIVFRPSHQFAPGFLGYALDSSTARSAKARMGRGYTVVHIYQSELRDLPVPTPPLEDQRRIAAFLNHETARIDELVREQERLISQLEAKRAATISHSIRGGLSSEARSETGNAWVDSIPASWRLTRLKFEALAVDCLHSTPAYLESGEYPAVRTADLSPGRLDLSNALRVSREEYMARNTRLVPRQGDIIYSREGTFGIAAVVPAGEQLCLGQRVMLLRPYYMDSQFLMWQLNADFVYQQALQDQIGATAARVNMETVANYVLVAPPKQEQKAIAQFLNASLRDIDNGVTAARSLISLLNERRSALISAAVTGQLDLRNWQTPELEAVAEVA